MDEILNRLILSTKILLLLLFLVLSLSSCNNEKRITRNYQAISFDTAVVSKLKFFDSIRNIAFINDVVLKGTKYFYFPVKNDPKSEFEWVEDLPTSLTVDLRTLRQHIGYQNIDGFYKTQDSTMEFYVRQELNKRLKVVISESLRWQPINKSSSNKDSLIKEIPISQNWVYRISYGKQLGW